MTKLAAVAVVVAAAAAVVVAGEILYRKGKENGMGIEECWKECAPHGIDGKTSFFPMTKKCRLLYTIKHFLH